MTEVAADNIGGITEEQPFDPDEERAIISLALDRPEFFISVGRYMSHKYFKQIETKWVYAIIEKMFDKHGFVPTREMIRAHAKRNLTADDDFEAYLGVIERPSEPREVPIIKDLLLDWAKDRAYGLLYGEEAISAYESKDYEKLEAILEEARKITDVSQAGLWFFSQKDSLFEKTVEDKLTCGYPKLDQYINEGGPTRGEVFVWMAPTGVGKSIMLPNSGIACIKRGLKVLHITLELSAYKTALRYAGALTNVEVHRRFEPDKRKTIDDILTKVKATYKGDLVIFEFPPDEISVDHIYQLIDQLKRTKNWKPDVIIIDYLELMMARKSYENKEEYTRQKKVATQVRGLAKKECVLVFTATQTNREQEAKKGAKIAMPIGPQVIDVNRMAESFGKAMPMDYLVSINQSPDEYNSKFPTLRFYIAKNRNGPKNKTVTATVNYQTFRVTEAQVTKATTK